MSPSCVVPGCINLLQEWVTDFPHAARLANRWWTAIEVGTGQQVPPQLQPQNAQICNMHFAVPAHMSDVPDENEYREPTLFFRDNILIQIACCELCLRFDTVNEMYSLSEQIGSGDGETLYALARKYFNFPRNSPQTGQYFCESCVVNIDMTHSFWRKINAIWKINKKVFRKMAQEKVVFRNSGSLLTNSVLVEERPATTISLCSSEDAEEVDPSKVITIDSDSNNDAGTHFDDIIVKEEPQVDYANYLEPPTVISYEANSIPCKCYICNSTFPDRTTLTEHISDTHEAKKRACKNCRRSFFSPLFYNDHMVTHKPHCCNYCPLEFNERREVIIHEVQQHAGEKLDESCTGCGKLFRSKLLLEEHMKTEDCTA